jgi:hypothetical protein
MAAIPVYPPAKTSAFRGKTLCLNVDRKLGPSHGHGSCMIILSPVYSVTPEDYVAECCLGHILSMGF